MPAKCVSHEVDIISVSPNCERYLIECKYHNYPGIITKLKESLYTHARFLDLKENRLNKELLISNTKVSKEVIQYSKCVWQEVLS